MNCPAQWCRRTAEAVVLAQQYLAACTVTGAWLSRPAACQPGREPRRQRDMAAATRRLTALATQLADSGTPRPAAAAGDGVASRRLPAAQLRAAVERIMEAGGCPPDERATVASLLVEANLYGHDSHGIQMVYKYMKALQSGYVTPGSKPQVRDAGGELEIRRSSEERGDGVPIAPQLRIVVVADHRHVIEVPTGELPAGVGAPHRPAEPDRRLAVRDR